jgi:hypothetical protein
MPTLLEVQRAMRASLLDREDNAAAAFLAEDASRLDIYRNTFVAGLTKALRLAFPAVQRLVGGDFFDGAAGAFIAKSPPAAAWLDRYGGDFPEFLSGFQPGATLVYLADVARLEWAANCALHAADIEPLRVPRLSALPPAEQGAVCFVPHPAVTLLHSAYPADTIWRGVLDADDAALAAVDLGEGPVHLLIERSDNGIEVSRLDERAWNFAALLCDGCPLETALATFGAGGADVLLAGHLTAGRFVDFRLAAPADAATDAPDRETAS